MSPDGPPQLESVLAKLSVSQNDEEAWRWLYKLMWPYVIALCWRPFWPDSDRAREVAQDVFYRIFRYADIGKLRDPRAFRVYVATVCANRVRDAKRSSTVVTESLEELGDVPDQRSDLAAAVEIRSTLADFLSTLDANDKHLLEMVISGASMKQVADELGISYEATATRLFRLRQKGAKWLKENQVQ